MLYYKSYTPFYLFSPIFIIALIAYAKDRDILNNDIYWYGLKFYTKCEELYLSYRKHFNTSEIISVVIDGIEIIQNICKKTAIKDNIILHDKVIECLTDTSMSILSVLPENYDMILYKIPCKDDKYDYLVKRINNFNEDYIVKRVEPLIIGIQINVYFHHKTSECLEVDLDKNYYYLEDNILFDYKFVEYILYKYFDISDYKNYKVSFFDKSNMNIVTLEKGDYIIIKSEGLVIKKRDEDFEHLVYEKELI